MPPSFYGLTAGGAPCPWRVRRRPRAFLCALSADPAVFDVPSNKALRPWDPTRKKSAGRDFSRFGPLPERPRSMATATAQYEQWLTSASRIVIRKPGRLVVRWRLPAASLAEAPRKPALVAAKKKLLSNTAVRRHKRLNGASGGVWCQWRHGPVCREHPGKRPSHWHRHCGCPYRAPSGLLVSRRRSRLGQGHVHYTLPARTHLHLT